MLYIVGILLFAISLSGLLLVRKNIMVYLLNIELMFLAINILFINQGCMFDDEFVQVISLLLLSVAAAESAIGLALFVIFFRLQDIININVLSRLKS
jgi:NADH-quinone oxidoreductase subunit K